MATNFLEKFINLLKQTNELKEITQFVDPVLQISEFTDRECKTADGGKALLFTNTGTDFPVLTNMYGSVKRITKALYCNSLSEIESEFKELFNLLTLPKDTFGKKIATLSQLKNITNFFPKVKRGLGQCQQVVMKNIDLFKIPILQTWPFDGGRFITLPMVNTRDPETNIRNVGMYRVQILTNDTTAMHWHQHKTGTRHFNQYKKLNKKMPIAIAIGGDPVYAYCATAPLPDGVDEYMLAGFIRKKPVKLVKCISQPEIEVPDDVDFVIEGYIDPSEPLVCEGPFGDHTGFYSLPDYYPKLHVTAITHRTNAIYTATVVGIPPMEDAYIAYATENIFKFPIKAAFVPELEDMHMPVCGVQHNIVIAKIKSQYLGNAVKVKNALWGAGQMMFNKILIVTNSDIPIRNYQQLFKELSDRFVAYRDVYIDRGGVSDVLDHSSRSFACGGKIMIDATGEPKFYSLPTPKFNIESITNKFSEIDLIDFSLLVNDISVVFIYLNYKTKTSVKEISTDLNNLLNIKCLIFVDEGLPKNDIFAALWYTSGNIDPSTDCFVIDNAIGGCLCVDATAKVSDIDNFMRQWPSAVVMDSKTIAEVDKLQIDLFGTTTQSPSQRFASLCGSSAVRYDISSVNHT